MPLSARLPTAMLSLVVFPPHKKIRCLPVVRVSPLISDNVVQNRGLYTVLELEEFYVFISHTKAHL